MSRWPFGAGRRSPRRGQLPPAPAPATALVGRGADAGARAPWRCSRSARSATSAAGWAPAGDSPVVLRAPGRSGQAPRRSRATGWSPARPSPRVAAPHPAGVPPRGTWPAPPRPLRGAGGRALDAGRRRRVHVVRPRDDTTVVRWWRAGGRVEPVTAGVTARRRADHRRTAVRARRRRRHLGAPVGSSGCSASPAAHTVVVRHRRRPSREHLLPVVGTGPSLGPPRPHQRPGP